jgi:hypothetical protein
MTKRKLIPKNVEPEVDTVAYDRAMNRDKGRSIDVLLMAQKDWDCMDKFRKDRARNKKYCFGDQWSDMVEYCGRMISEEEYIRMQGNIPLKNNLIRRLVKTVVGVYRNQNKTYVCTARDREEQKMGETMTVLLERNYDTNEKKELDARMFEEFLVSGLAVQKEVWGFKNKRYDCLSENVNPNYFFMDGGLVDPRMTDVTVIGELHDISFGQLCAAFAKSDADIKKLRDIYKTARNDIYMRSYADTFNRNSEDMVSFLVPQDRTLCRVVEVWTEEQRKALWCHDYLTGDAYIDKYENKAAIDAENASRMEDNRMKDIEGNYIYDELGNIQLQMSEDRVPLIEYEYMVENYWYYRFLSPLGDVLDEGETPYLHGEHPYVVKAFPLIDGEIHPFVADVIDQQRYINHYIILNDFIVKSSAKGTLIVDESSIPADMSLEDVAEEWTKYNGVIKLKLKDGAKIPQQMANQNRVAGLQDMITLQMQLMDDVSGVHGALQGKNATSGTSGILYEQQANNASTSIIDMLETFSSFLGASARKKLHNIQQFYDEPVIVKVAGKSNVVKYDPVTMGGVDFDVALSESYDTPVYRAINNDLLMQLLNAQQITLKQLLEAGSFPFADRLLQMIESNEQSMQQMQQPITQ